MRVREVAYFHEIKGICNAEDRFNVYSFLAVSVMLELQCTESLV